VAVFIIRRLIWSVVLMLAISFVTFLIFFILPSDSRGVQGGYRGGRGSTDPNLNLQFQFGIKQDSLPQQYGQFLWSVFRHGSLGHSFIEGVPVTDMIKQALPVTASLLIGGGILWVLISFPIGILCALRPRSLLDRGSMIFVLIGISAHPVWLGLILSWVFGYKLGILPISGYCDFFSPTAICGGPVQWFYHLILPWLAFAMVFAALYARMIRASVIEALDEDYVRTARAKGASSIRVLRHHVLQNAMLPVVSMLGMDLALAFGGAIFIETVFGLPGMGKLLVSSLPRRDLPVIMGIVLVISLAVSIANTIVDIVHGVLDPRVRVRTGGRARGGRRSAARGGAVQAAPNVSPT
jgi:peptide/nickel transport system permease protein